MKKCGRIIETGTPEEVAARWVMYLSSDECEPADRASFEEWRLADPTHAEAFDRVERSLTFVDRHLSHPSLMQLKQDVLEETKPRPYIRIGGTLGLAACIAGILILVTGLMYYTPDMVKVAASYDTAVNERSTVTLTDGSKITLNTNTSVDVDFNSEQRSIKLEHGQAIFEVARDVSWPFVVYAGNQKITALGTAFDVRLNTPQQEIQVVLLEGRVAVDEFSDGSAGDTAAKRVELVPGERFVASGRGLERKVSKVDVSQITSWRDGRLVFRGEALEDAILEINRYSVDQLRLSDDERLKALRINGVFDTGRLTSFVAAIEAMHSVKAQKTDKNEIIRVWDE